MYYALDWSQHRDRSIIVNTIESTGRFARVAPDAPVHSATLQCSE
jgi:hypothetical protein